MGQKSSGNYAAGKDVQIRLRKEECALGMGLNDVAARDVQIKLRMEECASLMGQRGSYA